VLEQHVDLLEWMRVGQLNRLLKFFHAQEIRHAIMGRTNRAEEPFRSASGLESVDVARQT